MRFDKTNFSNITSCVQQLNSNKQFKTVTIGQLDSSQLVILLNELASITHIKTILFEYYGSVAMNLEFIIKYIQKNKKEFEFLNTNEDQRCEILSFAYSVELDVLYDEINNTIHIKSPTPTTALQDQQMQYAKEHSDDFTQNIVNAELLSVPPNSPQKAADDRANPFDSDSDKKRKQTHKAFSADNIAKRSCQEISALISQTEFDSILSLKQLTHTACGEAGNLHRVICNGNEEEVLIAFTVIAENKRIGLLNKCCLDEHTNGASVLKLALSVDNAELIGALINLGANPFQLSANGNTIVHDIVLGLNSDALNFFLANVDASEELTQFINTPFLSSKVYYGYYALDLVCLESAHYFDDYNEAQKPQNKEDSKSTHEIIRQLLLHRAQSKLLIDAHRDINSVIDIKNIENCTLKDVWTLIETIESIFQDLPSHDPVETSATMNATKLLAKTWADQGLLPAIPKDEDSQFASLVEQGVLTPEEAAAQYELLQSYQSCKQTH